MKSRQERLIALAMVAPSLVLLAIFVYGFIGQTIYVSMSDWAGAALALDPDISFIGLDNPDLFTGFDCVSARTWCNKALSISLVGGAWSSGSFRPPCWTRACGAKAFRPCSCFLCPCRLS